MILSLGCFTTQERGFWQARNLLYLAPRRDHDQPPASVAAGHWNAFNHGAPAFASFLGGALTPKISRAILPLHSIKSRRRAAASPTRSR
jgi:hypothetical protein